MLAQEARSLCTVKLQVTGPEVLSKSFARANVGGHRSISRYMWKATVPLHRMCSLGGFAQQHGSKAVYH